MMSERELRRHSDRTPHGISAAILCPTLEYYRQIKTKLRMPTNPALARKRLFHFLRKCYKDNPEMRRRIPEVEQYYTHDKAIYYYTNLTLFANNFNRFLRSEDIRAISKLQYFLQGLHNQLQHLNKSKKYTSFTEVYRGKS